MKCIPPKPHFYIEKLGFAGVHLMFLFLIQNIYVHYGYKTYIMGTASNVPTMYVFIKNIKSIKIFLVKFSIFTAEKNLYIAWV